MKICPACRSAFESDVWACGACGWAAPVRGRVHCVGAFEAVEGFRAESFPALAAVENDYFWFRSRNDLIAWSLSRYFPAAESFLDAGCGNGQVSRALARARPGLRVTACEAFAEGLALAASTAPDVHLVQADVRDLPWVDEFDAAGAFDVLEHIEDDARAVRQLAAAVRPGGGVLVTVPQHEWLWSAVDDYSRHVRRYRRAQLRARLEEAGLQILRITSFVTLLLPALLAARTLRRSGPIDPCAEFRVPSAVNAIALRAMAVERTLIRAGLSLPAGGSLLAIARRPRS